MSNKDGAERACKEPNPIIDGRKANVNLAYLGAKPRGITTGLSLSGKLLSFLRCILFLQHVSLLYLKQFQILGS